MPTHPSLSVRISTFPRISVCLWRVLRYPTLMSHKVSRWLSSLATPKAPLTLGIRREDPRRVWERRAPLTPDAVHHLISQRNVDVHIEHCDRRVFSDAEYIKAGAEIRPNLEGAHIIIGIKEPPLSEIVTTPLPASSPPHFDGSRARTHLMFSHTAKGQPYNTELLSRFITPSMTKENEWRPRLVDYELLKNDSDGKRTVGFGWFAGVAGVLESLSSMAQSHLEAGIASPFLYTPRPFTHPSLESLRAALRSIGNQIAEEGTPARLGPFVIGVTGTGNVSQGCLSMLQELPIVNVPLNSLHDLVTNKDTDLRKIYLIHAKPEDYLVRSDGLPYERLHYYANPQSYRSIFCDNVAPYLTLFLNGAGWSPTFPRLMTNEQLLIALRKAKALGDLQFRNIGDISCDVTGGLEFLDRATTLSSPFYKITPDPLDVNLGSVQMMSVDILPASLPLDASQHFSKALLPYLESVIKQYTSGTRDEYAPALERATIAEEGQLIDQHKWLQAGVDKFYGRGPATSITELQKKETAPPAKKKILMLGTGMVSGPAVDEITKRSDIQLMIVSDSLPEAQKIIQEYPNVKYRIANMADKSSVSILIGQADVVISLLPVGFHTTVAELCIFHKKHLVTASYISPQMRDLHDHALGADVLLLNEIGLDPGIDHCSAIDLISQLRDKNQSIVSFTSFCGGLPAPDVPYGPLGYKFSWSPKGVLAAALNDARFRLKGREVNISGDNLLIDIFPDVPITEKFNLEGIANRDSMPYADTYAINSARTVLRGTLRYPGFSSLMQSFKSLGFLETQTKISLSRWSDFIPQCLSYLRPDLNMLFNKNKPLLSQIDTDIMIEEIVPPKHRRDLYEALTVLSLLPTPTNHPLSNQMPPLLSQPATPIDIFAYLLSHKLAYKAGERDMVVLSHEIISKTGNDVNAPMEVHTSSLITYGTPKASAMARTVGLPVAFAALNIADGKIAMRGVTGPTDPSIYKPVLRGLEEVGLGMTESTRVLDDKRPSLEEKLFDGIVGIGG